MILLPGQKVTVAHESVSDQMLMQFGLLQPDFIPTIMRLYKNEISPLISILDMKGAKTQGINFSTNDGNYRTVGSNHVQFKTDAPEITKFRFANNSSGKSFVSYAYPSKPGYKQTEFSIWVDSNWAGYKEVIELGDNKTQLYVIDDPKDEGGVTRLLVKLVTKDPEEYVDVNLLMANSEANTVMNMHEQDFSERSTEKYIFGGFADAYLSLQRFKYSWSGTAAAKIKNGKVTGKFVLHQGEKTFLTEAEYLMMKRAAEYLEYQMMWGKGTVSESTKKVILHDKQGREVLAGDGIMNANGGPIEIPQNQGWTEKFLDNTLTNIDQYITNDSNGKREVAMFMAPKSYLSFQRLMRKFGVTMNANIEGSGSEKGINDTYSYYELDGIRLIPNKHRNFSSVNRPGIPLVDGTYNNDWESIMLPIGETANGMKNFELIQLRPSAEGTVAGIDMKGNISSSVDGSSKHILFQNGIIARARCFRIFRPVSGSQIVSY